MYSGPVSGTCVYDTCTQWHIVQWHVCMYVYTVARVCRWQWGTVLQYSISHCTQCAQLPVAMSAVQLGRRVAALAADWQTGSPAE